MQIGVANTEPRTWNYRWMILALVVGVWLQWHLLMIYSGRAIDLFYPYLALRAALLFDGLVIVRIVVAALRRERNGVWLLYSLLCLSSFLWIAVMTGIIGILIRF